MAVSDGMGLHISKCERLEQRTVIDRDSGIVRMGVKCTPCR